MSVFENRDLFFAHYTVGVRFCFRGGKYRVIRKWLKVAVDAHPWLGVRCDMKIGAVEFYQLLKKLGKLWRGFAVVGFGYCLVA